MQIQEFYSLVPHIDTLNRNQVDQVLTKIRGMYEKMDDQNLSFAMFKMSESIMKLKTFNHEIHDFLQECIKDIIRISTHRNFAVGTEALRNIFNTDAEFYKHSRLDVESRFPLGLRHPLKNYQPQVGQQCDIVKPYISSISYCSWTRCTVISKDGKKYLVKYANSLLPSQTKDQPFCAPLGTRTEDFEWRMNLKIGDQVEAYHKVWYRGTVAGVEIENSIMRARITFKTYHQNGQKVDRHGNKYDGLSDQDDEVHDVTSYRIQKPGTIAKSLCQYSANSQQFVLDDTYDLIFRKQYQQQKFRAIMRLNFTKSLSFLEFYQTFCQCQGNQKFLQLLEQYNKDNLQSVFNVMIIVANSSFLIPNMRIGEFLPQMINKVVELLFSNTKNLSPSRNEMASFFIDVAAKRVMSLTEKHLLVHEIRKRLAIDFLKLNMEKQMIALRLLYEIINPMPRKHTEKQKLKVDEFLLEQNIFYQLAQPNTHEQILLRAVQLIKYMLQNSIITFKQIQYLWNIFPASDIRGRATVQKMIGQISRVLTISDTEKMIQKILAYKEEQLTADNLSLLRSLKDHKELTDDTRLLILQRMWQIITQKSTNITQSIQEQVQKVFKSVLPALNSNHTKLQLLMMILNRLQEAKYLRSQFDILKEVILTYPKRVQTKNKSNDILKIEEQTQQNQLHMKDQSQEIQIANQNVPQTLPEVMEYLKQKNIYSTITNLFNQLKNPQKMKTVLWFTSFLFENDKDQVSNIVKVFYGKMGPTDVFFEWAQHIVEKAQLFFVQLLGNFQDMSKFQQLSNKGFEALKQIIFDVNVNLKNIKIVKKMKSTSVQSSSQKINTKDQQKNQSSGKGPIYGPTQKPQTLTFLYLLKSPYECKGIKFLQQLLCVVKNSKVYDEIIKMIIQFFVNLDESIIPRTKQFRSQFLMEIIEKFSEINMKNEFDDKIKTRLEMNVGLLQQLFAETQKDGLLDIKPHFQSVQGEMLKLSIQNHITNNKVADQKIEVSENVTLWTFKNIIGNLFGQKPQQLSIHKFMSPIADQLNAKSLSDLHFYNKQSIRVQRKPAKDIPRKDLVNQTGQALSPKFDLVVQKWFNSYKNSSQLLGMQELKKLSSELWRGSALKQVNKLSEMINKFDLTNKNALSLEEFKQFFIFKSAQNNVAVWRLINLSGYNNNLKYKDDKDQEVVDSSIYPRKILSTQKVYNVIFSLLENPTFEAVHLNFYRLLAQLQTDNTLKEEVRKNAKSLISDQKSVYKLSYILQTILAEIFVNDEFFVQFYRAKGCEFIYQRLSSIMLQQKSIYTFDTLLKTIIMPNMLKITNSYIYCLYSSNKMNRFLKKSKINHIQLDFLQSQVKKVDQIVADKNENEQRLLELSKIEPYINERQLLDLSQKILRNLINFFNNDLLQKLTNQLIRSYSILCLTQNQLNFDTILIGLKCESLNYRRSCQNIAYLYILNNQSHVKQFLQLLLSNLPQQSKAIYSYYFKLLQKVLEMYIDMKKEQQDDTQFVQLTDRLFKKLFNELPNQNRNAVVADKLLLGVLMVINVLVTKRPNVCKHFVHLKKQLLTKCLFFYHPRDRLAQLEITPQLLTTPNQPNHFPDYVKCKSEETRKILMEIIFHLHEVSASQDPLFVDQYILPVFDDLPDKKRKFDTKSMQVGISNLGSTCYMNSMLQLINSVPQFRNLLMMSKSEAPLVKELKKLFSYLFYSQRQDYTPQDLLKAFTPPIQKGIQQDTTEFLNILLDQLDKCLKGTPEHNLLEEMFQGTQATQMICHACQQKRQREQTFFTYSVDVEGKYDLNSALQGMNMGEVISDCACEYCGQRSDTTKRTIIDKIPKYFFVPLKRIVFNYDVFMNTKIHTRLQFPPELNFEPYTKEGIELRQSLGLEYMKNLKDNEEERKKFQELALHGHDKNYYKLKLKGIIVHSGGPQVGHYWAITRRQNSWLKFDDSKVAVFPHSNMEGQCYGGNFQSDEWGGMGSSTNAYVLLYERQLKHDIILGEQHQQQRRVISFDKIDTFNTAELYKQVWLDNHSLMLQNHLLKQSYSKQFLHFLVQMLKITPSQSKIKVISQTLYKVCYHSGQVGKLNQALMQNLSQLNFEIFTKYIIAEKHKTFQLLFHNNLTVREFTASFIEKTLLETFKKGSSQQKQQIIKFIQEYLLLIHSQVAKNWLRIDGYFKLFLGLVTDSVSLPQLYKYFIDKHLIAYFIDFIMEKSSPLNIYPKKYSVGTKSNPAHFGHALQLIFFLIKRSYGFTGENYELPTPPADELFHLSQNEALCLSSIPFYEKMLRERQNLEILGLIIQRLSIKNIKFSEAIARVMIIQLNQVTDAKDQMVDICSCISKFLVITDEFWHKRAEFIVGYSSPYIFNDNLLSSLDEERFVYASTLQDLFPVECLLAYCHINKLRNPLTVLHIIKTILEGCSVNSQGRQYLLSQRAPSYIHERYIDWIRPYVNNVVDSLSLTKQKKQEVLKQVESCNNYLTDLQKQKCPIDNIITGKIGNSFVVDRFSSSDNLIQVAISNVESYTVKSQPTGQGNKTLDNFLVHGRLSKKVTSDSNILLLFKQFSKPLAIKQALQQDEDKQIQGLFDDYVDPRISSGKDTHTVETQANSQHQSQEVVKVIEKEDKKIQQEKIKQGSQQKMVSEQVVQNKMETQQEVVQQVNIHGVQLTSDYFRKIEIINNSNKTKRVTLLFRSKQNSNMLVPSKMFFVSTKVAVQTIWICKIDSTKGWGPVDYELIVQEKDPKPFPKSFKLYGLDQQTNSQNEAMEIEGPVPQQANLQPQYEASNNYAEEITEISCPICTLLNLSTETICEACGSNLRG